VTRAKLTVLVFESDASMREALRSLLEASGFNVEVFERGAELGAGPTTRGPACALVDFDLPDVNGIEFCTRLAARIPPIPAILMSSYDNTAIRKMVRKYEPVTCLLKPFDRHALVRAIRKAIRSAQ